MTKPGRTQALRKRFENLAEPPAQGSTTGAEGVARVIENSPLPPEVPPRPERIRQRQNDLTPPPSPLNERHHQSPGLPSNASQAPEVVRPPTPSYSNATIDSHASPLSEGHRSPGIGSLSLEDLRAELNEVREDVDKLTARLGIQDKEIQNLRSQLKTAEDRYRDAISDLRFTRQERDELQGQVERYRRELASETDERRSVAKDLDAAQEREGRLRQEVTRMRERDESRIEELRRMRGDHDDEIQSIHQRLDGLESLPQAGERRSKKQYHLQSKDKPESRVSWSRQKPGWRPPC